MNVVIANRQRTKKINARLLRKIVEALLVELEIAEAELGINLVAAPEMTLVNKTFLHHAGSTDVITFDHLEPAAGQRPSELKLHGELYVCVDEAIQQARQFKTNWRAEVVRYIIHGVLHLVGHDDLHPAVRRTMKRAENRLVRLLIRRFSLAQLSGAVKLRA